MRSRQTRFPFAAFINASSAVLTLLALWRAGAFAQGPLANAHGISVPPHADAAYEKGMLLLREKKYSEALEEFRSVGLIAPQIPQGPCGEGIALALMGKPEEAIRALKKALEIDPSYWVAQRELGIVYWGKNLKDFAAKELLSVNRLHPDDPPVNLILAQYEFENRNYAEAVIFFSRVEARVEQDPELALMEAEALLRTGEKTRAARLLAELADLPGTTSAQRFKLAWLLGESGLNKSAIRTFTSLPPDYPSVLERSYGLALAYFEDRRYAACIGVLESAREKNATAPALFGLLGVAYEKSGQTQRAYDAFRQGILAYPQDPQNYLNIATLACQHLSFDLAVEILTSGIARNPQADLYLARGIARALKAQFKLAEADYQTAIRLAPQLGDSYLALGLCYLEEGKLEEAVQSLKEAASRSPRDPRPYYFLTEALLQQGASPGAPAFDEAQRAIQTALLLDPNAPDAYVDRAKIELRTDHIDLALADLERARKLDPHSRPAAYMLAQLSMKKGERKKAARLFAKVKHSSEQDATQFRRRALTRALIVVSEKARESGGN